MRPMTKDVMLLLMACVSIYACNQKSSGHEVAHTSTRPNVLFITVDDLRPQLGCYGDTIVKSPNIDQLAGQGILFERAYCQQALCGPSRTSFLTGLRPGTIGVNNLRKHFRSVRPGIITLPQLFKQNGYVTKSLFKVFHLVGFAPKVWGNMDDSLSWSEPSWLPSRSAWGPYGDSIYQAHYQKCLEKGPVGYQNIPRSLAYEAPGIADDQLSDGETALEAINFLGDHKNDPFFLAVGFYKPHLPFVAPKKYWDLYDRSQLRLPNNQYSPKGAPGYAVADTKELRSYVNIPKEGQFSDLLKGNLLHGYLASISYIDAQVGLILEKLETLGLRENTIVVLLGDHGYQIGEHDMWCKKHTNFEMATRAPLIISAPGQQRGVKTSSLTELIDIYPTIAELANLHPPDDLDGLSLMPLLQNPELNLKAHAKSSYPRGPGIGHSIRTNRYRLTKWLNQQDSVVAYELYDHQVDPQENVSVAYDPGYQSILESLSKMLDN